MRKEKLIDDNKIKGGLIDKIFDLINRGSKRRR
jgi:hypothetical protein